jgi:enoyl-CoA hydratase
VQGAALGGGAGLAIACDLVVAAEDVRFGDPGAGNTPVGLVVLAMLRDIMGGRAAFAMISQGRVFAGAEMATSSLAQRVVPAADVMSAALQIASAWALINPAAMAAHKALFRARTLE